MPVTSLMTSRCHHWLQKHQADLGNSRKMYLCLCRWWVIKCTTLVRIWSLGPTPRFRGRARTDDNLVASPDFRPALAYTNHNLPILGGWWLLYEKAWIHLFLLYATKQDSATTWQERNTWAENFRDDIIAMCCYYSSWLYLPWRQKMAKQYC